MGGGRLFSFLQTHRIDSPDITKVWLESSTENIKRINFDGAFLPDISDESVYNSVMPGIIVDTFLFHVLRLDDYDKNDIGKLEPSMPEGPYGFRNGSFDVRVKKGDVVIDAGAWIGDFAALSAYYGAAETYAFEPVKSSFEMLKKTAALNKNIIHPVQKGLGRSEFETTISLSERSGSESAVTNNNAEITEIIKITTLDKFVNDEGLKKIDFIKADIEGMERELLMGARQTLKEFAPKLAICTYHLPDDPKVLKEIILDANPEYKIVQRKCKLYAARF